MFNFKKCLSDPIVDLFKAFLNHVGDNFCSGVIRDKTYIIAVCHLQSSDIANHTF